MDPPPSLAWATGNMPGGHGRPGSSARAARRVVRVPRGLAGGPEPAVLGHGDRTELGGVGAAGEDEAGGGTKSVGDGGSLARLGSVGAPRDP